jgi:ketosteroid isomerase-like protein
MTQTHRAITDDQLLAGWEKGEQAAWEQGDTSGFDDVYSDDLVYHLPPFPDVDKAGLRETASVFHKAWPDFQFQLDEQFATDSTTVYRWRCDGHFSGESSMFTVPPTGNETVASGAMIFHWTDGKVTEVWHFGDWLGWLVQAGVLPPIPR